MALLAENLKSLPQKPGVYLFKDARGEVLYVGKAKNLKNRVRSYFVGQPESIKTALLREEIADLNYAIVSTELESLMLENNFIKQYRPRYNVRLRDDKNYQFIKVDYETAIPQVYPVRRLTKKSKAKYFGPYTSGLAVKETLKLLRRLFALCGNKKVGNRPCFAYHLGRCPGVCVGKIPLKTYRQNFTAVEDFLAHRQSAMLHDLAREMRLAAARREFERAAVLRDKIRALKKIWERQKVVFTKAYDADFWSVFAASSRAVVHLFAVREGRIVHQEHFEAATAGASAPSVLDALLEQYYQDTSSIPKEIYTAYRLANRSLLERWLRLKVRQPRRGKKVALLRLGEENARDYFQRSIASFENSLAGLQQLLRLPGMPRRIEAYDISNIQGFLPVGSMVVFLDGQPKKSEYRKFKIRLKQTPNDVGMMREMLNRRFKHLRKTNAPHPPLKPALSGVEGERRGEGKLWPKPDLIVIDGGKGQLNAAVEVLKTSKLRLPIIGLAKRLEEIFLPGKKESLRLPPDTPMLHLLQRLRDEAHRFAISFYRVRHRREGARSRLDEISGVGPTTKKKLLQRFGTLSTIRNTSLEALAKEIGPALAKKIKEAL